MGLRDKAKAYRENKPKSGIKYDSDKPRWELLPLDEIEDVVKVLTMGAVKYDDDNWKHVRPTNRYIGAAYRHMKDAIKGEKIDSDSGVSHYAHAICCLLFLAWFERHPEEETPDNIEQMLFPVDIGEDE